MILAKDQLVFLVFLLAATLFCWGAVQTKMVYDMREYTSSIGEAQIVCGEIDARILLDLGE